MRTLYKSGQVADLYGITTETLRTWSRDFTDYLSSSAQADTGKQRLYTREDLQVISLIAELRQDNLSYPEIHLALKNGQRGQPPALDPDELRELQKQAEQETDPETLQTLLVKTQTALETAQRQLVQLQEYKEKKIRLETSLEYITKERDQLKEQIQQLSKRVEELSKESGDHYARGFKEGIVFQRGSESND